MAAVELASTSLASDANLVAYYKLENVNDSKGSRTLTNNLTVTFSAAKFNNGAVMDNATQNYLNRTADDYGMAGTADVGISFWYKCVAAPSSGTTYGLFALRSQTTTSRILTAEYKNNGGTLQLVINNSGNTATYNVDLGTSTFHNIVVTRVGTASLKLFLDDVDTGVTAAQGSTTAPASDFGISTNGAVSGSSTFDDLAIFNRVLTQADVDIINGISTGGYIFIQP